MLIMPNAMGNKDVLWVLQREDRILSIKQKLAYNVAVESKVRKKKTGLCNYHNSFLLVEVFCSILFIPLLREWASSSCSRSCNITANHNLNCCK